MKNYSLRFAAMPSKSLIEALSPTDYSLYESMYSTNHKHLAQRALAGRTHHVDDSTLRGFKARVTKTRQSEDGLWFALRESLPVPGEGGSSRQHRWCIFDVFGTCHRAALENTSAAADALFSELRDSIDWETHTRDELEWRMVRQAEAAAKALAALKSGDNKENTDE